MKHLFYTLFIASAVLLLASCAKQEVLSTPPRIVKIVLAGNTPEAVNYIYKDSIIASANAGGIVGSVMLPVSDKNPIISIVSKSNSDTLLQQPVMISPYEQVINFFYDGVKIYDTAVSLQLKGYVLSGQLEFRSEGKLLYAGTGDVNTRVQLLASKNTPRKVEVFKAGETTPLLSRDIQSSPYYQTISFFYDGNRMVENIQLPLPANPANMMITAKFQTIFPTLFKNVDVDMLFYIKNTSTSAIVKTNPEIRFTLPASGVLTSIELPPLPAATGYVYTFDLYEKGTTNLPYTSLVPPVVQNGFPYQKSEGMYGDFTFIAGASKLWLINDKKTIKATPRATHVHGSYLDLSVYFQ